MQDQKPKEANSNTVLTILIALKQGIAAIYSNFTSTSYEHGDMRVSDGFVAGPKGNGLYLKFRHV